MVENQFRLETPFSFREKGGDEGNERVSGIYATLVRRRP